MKRNVTVVIFLLAGILSGQGRVLTLEEAITGRGLRIESISTLSWIGSTNHYGYVDSLNGGYGLIEASPAGEERMLLSLDSLNRALEAAAVEPLRYFPRVRWESDTEMRFMNGGALISFDVAGKQATLLSRPPADGENVTFAESSLRAAFTRGGNLFVCTEKGEEIKVTGDGGDGVTYGSPNVHRNEFGINSGIFWAPGGKAVAFYRRDETMVSEYPLVDIDSRPARVRQIRYPMAGMTSEQVSIWVYHVDSGSITRLETGGPLDQYLPHVTWSPDAAHLYVVHLNREQDRLQLKVYDPVSGACERTLFEESHDRWVEPEHGPLFLDGDPERFIWFSRRDGFNNLYLYGESGRLLQQLTRGRFDVGEIAGIEKGGRYLYYTAASEDGMSDHGYRLDLRSGRSTRLTRDSGMHRIDPSSDGSLFIDRFNSSRVPSRITVHDRNGTEKRRLLEAEDPLKDFTVGEIRYITIPNQDGIDLNARIVLPAEFDPSRTYPVIVYVYGGPHGQMVRDQWLAGWPLWFQYMAGKGYIIFSLDNRGTNNRGLAFEQAIHRQLGELEVQDQMAGIDYLKSLPYVDSERIGVHGWSYGGFMTVSMMTRHPGVFRAAVAGGPVIDWRYYEVMYGERYMDTPQSNPEGYDRASLLNYVDQLEGSLLLIHGTVDPIVVWQNSLSYLRKAIDLGKQVDYFVYPGQEHNMRGRDRVHLYQKISDYFDLHMR
ncbi:DPP IV N-terminal domain-containing protein [bacterium]|nr:DPP IV N-terminal domain-containing protein [bacterium]